MSRGGKGDWARVPGVIDGHLHFSPKAWEGTSRGTSWSVVLFQGAVWRFLLSCPHLSIMAWFASYPLSPFEKKKILSRCPFTETRDLSPTSCSAVGWYTCLGRPSPQGEAHLASSRLWAPARIFYKPRLCEPLAVAWIPGEKTGRGQETAPQDPPSMMQRGIPHYLHSRRSRVCHGDPKCWEQSHLWKQSNWCVTNTQETWKNWQQPSCHQM